MGFGLSHCSLSHLGVEVLVGVMYLIQQESVSSVVASKWEERGKNLFLFFQEGAEVGL